MLTEVQLLKLKESYAAWFEPGDDLDLSEVAQDMTNLVDEILATRKRAEAAERERDGFQQWATTLESAGWQDAGFCPQCGKDDVRKSIDVLEPDAAKEIHYCCSCGRAWVIGHKQPTRV